MTIKFVAHIKKWFDKKNGNSYFSARIYDVLEDSDAIHIEFDYGYGNHPRHMVLMICMELLPEAEHWQPYEVAKLIHYIEEENCLKRDVVAWGKAE